MALHTPSLFFMTKTIVAFQWLEEAVAFDQQYGTCFVNSREDSTMVKLTKKLIMVTKIALELIQLQTTVKLPQRQKLDHKDNWSHKT